MSHYKSILWLALISSGGLLVGQVSADDVPETSYETGGPPPFQAVLKNGETIGVEQIRRAFLTLGTNKFGFVVPDGFRMDASSPQKIVLSDPNYNWYLAIRIAAPLPSRVDGSVQTEYARDILLRQHPGAKISDEFSLSAANSPGPAFDAQWEGVSGTVQSTRVAFIPFPVGILEFSLLSKPEKFTQGKYFLNFLLLTFRSNEGGNLDMPVFSGKS